MCEHCSTGTGWTEPFSQEAGICEYAPEPEKGSELPDMCPNYPVAWASNFGQQKSPLSRTVLSFYQLGVEAVNFL